MYCLTRLCLEGFLLNILKGWYRFLPAPVPPAAPRGFPRPPLQMGASSPWFPQPQFRGSPSPNSETKSSETKVPEQKVMKQKL